MHLLLDRDFHIVISIGTFACYLFLSSCFISVTRDEPIVHYLRGIMTALLCWTGGIMLMRLQISPGLWFWHHFSMLSLFLIPVGIYGFLFCVLEITGKKRLLVFWLLLSVAMAALNIFTGCLLPAPTVWYMADGRVSYVYQAKPGILIWAAAEIIFLIYITVLAHKKIGINYGYRRRLAPLLLGTICLLGGSGLCLTSWGAEVPFEELGGVCMAVCFVYTIYKQYLFSLKSRVIAGISYFMAAVVAFSPIILLDFFLKQTVKEVSRYTRQSLFVFMLAECLWCILILAFTRKRVEYLLFRRRKYIVESLVEFQDTVTSAMNKKRLYQMIQETVGKAVLGSCTHIFEEKDGKIVEYTANGKRILTEEEEIQIRQLYGKVEDGKAPEAAVFKYDNKIVGCLYVELKRKKRLIYDEADCIRQIGNSVSGVLKGINAYEELYQVSIHDELTGLYNRNYCLECLEKWDITASPAGMIYLDMDNFKLYNELYGEKTGDRVLQWCAEQMQKLAGSTMQIFRVGSNEFLIIGAENDKKKLVSLAKLIQTTILKTTEDKPKVIQLITFSIGIAWDRTMAENARELFHQARRAAFYAKENGKNRIEIYEKNIEAKDQNNEKGYNQISPTIFALMAAVDAKDSFTFEHSENVSEYAVKLAEKLKLPEKDIQTVKVAGLLHDIGKIGIPESILKKNGKLTDEEYAMMKTHVEKSVEMIRFLPNMDYVIPAVVSHHERYDGKGYPNGIKGKDIPVLGRILAVCDSFDAMISRRAYKEALSVDYAVGELERGKGTQFDPEAAQAFIEMVEEDPGFVAHQSSGR